KRRQKEDSAVVGAPVPKTYRRQKRDTVQVDLMALLQYLRQLCGTRRPIALADEKFRRRPALVASQILIDKIGKDRGVLDDTVELSRVLAWRGTAVAGGHCVNKDQIGHIQKRVAVLDDRVRRRHAVPIVCQHDASWTETHVSVRRRRTWTTVVDKR